MKPIRVALVDDHMLVRAGVKSLLDGAADIEVVGEADTAEKAIDLVRRARPDVVLLDLQLPGANGLSLFCDLVELGTGARIVVLSAFLNGQLLRTCLGVGAYGYITKESVDPRLADMLRRVMAGEKVFDANAVNVMSASFSQADDATSILTFRELQVLREMGAGLSNTQIATKLGILENTVKDYAKALMAKLGVHNRTEVAVKGFETGLI